MEKNYRKTIQRLQEQYRHILDQIIKNIFFLFVDRFSISSTRIHQFPFDSTRLGKALPHWFEGEQLVDHHQFGQFIIWAMGGREGQLHRR